MTAADGTLLAVRLLLAAVFAAAGLGKLADLAGSRRALVEFGLSQSVAGWAAVVVPVVELGVAVALVPPASTGWGGAGGLALLTMFTVAILVNLAGGRRPDCHCFGRLSARPIGVDTVARNVILLVLTGLIITRGPGPPVGAGIRALGERSAAQLAGITVALLVLLAVALLAWLLLNVIQQNGRLLLRLDSIEAALRTQGMAVGPTDEAGLPVGSAAPEFTLPDVFGATLSLEDLTRAGRPVALIFTDPNCSPCNALLPEIARWQRKGRDRLTVAVISRGALAINQAKGSEHRIRNLVLQKDFEVADAYHSVATPSAVLVGADRRILTPAVAGADAIRMLIGQAMNQTGVPDQLNGTKIPIANGHRPMQSAEGLAVGRPAPAVALPDLEGETVRLVDFLGSPTVVLFWHPSCGFCQAMLDDLKAWDHGAGPRDPRLLVVSAGTPSENRAMGLSSPVVLDETASVMAAFGANGTPMAVLVDADGRMASPLAAGAPAALALIQGAKPSLATNRFAQKSAH